MIEPNIEYLIDKTAFFVFFLIIFWIVYKYLNIRFEAMRIDIEREIKAKRLRGTGTFNVLGDSPKVGTVEVDLIWGVADKK